MTIEKTIKAPAEFKGKKTVIEITGKVAKLYVGPYQRKFFIHHDIIGKAYLTHYDSGYKLGCLDAVKIRYFRSNYSMTDRGAAKVFLAELVDKFGFDIVDAKFSAAPVIN